MIVFVYDGVNIPPHTDGVVPCRRVSSIHYKVRCGHTHYDIAMVKAVLPSVTYLKGIMSI